MDETSASFKVTCEKCFFFLKLHNSGIGDKNFINKRK